MLIVQVSYQTAGGGIVPLATSRDRALAREVARRIIAELESLQVGDRVTRKLAQLESEHLSKVMGIVDCAPLQKNAVTA